MTEAELVEAIEHSPDDSALFAYGAYLRTMGDPRGQEKLKAADIKALLGAFAKSTSPIKVESWRLGFADHVRIVADDEKHALQLLDAVIEHPSLRFVRTLELVMIGKRRSYAGVDARLVELGRPRTLTKLVLGKPGDHAMSPALLAAFPRIGALPRKTWDDVATAIRAIRAAAPRWEPTTAPGPLSPSELVRGLAAEIGRKQPIGIVARLVEDCSPAQLDVLSASLITAWTLDGEEGDAWVYEVASRIGGTESARLLGRRLPTASHVRAEHAIDCLARMSCPAAIVELFVASQHWQARGELAETALETRARAAKTDVVSLLAHAGHEDRRIVEYLMTAKWQAPLSTMRSLFGAQPSLVWKTDDRLFALDGDRCVSHDGRVIDILPERLVELAHVTDELRDLDAWRAWQATREVGFEQLARTAPRHDTIEAIEEKVAYWFDVDALRTRGFRNGGLKNELYEENRFVKTYRHRGEPYTITLEHFAGRREVRAARPLPAIVRFELARDLAIVMTVPSVPS